MMAASTRFNPSSSMSAMYTLAPCWAIILVFHLALAARGAGHDDHLTFEFTRAFRYARTNCLACASAKIFSSKAF